jgi:hypothetical protein
MRHWHFLAVNDIMALPIFIDRFIFQELMAHELMAE